MPNIVSPWMKGATPNNPVATKINAWKNLYYEPWDLDCADMKLVNVPYNYDLLYCTQKIE